jgi:UDP-glucose 4-epimerase
MSSKERIIMSKIIVTGGAGYIGSHVTYDLLNKNYNVIVLDNLSNSSTLNLDNISRKFMQKMFVYYGGCENIERFEPRDVSGIIHFAAFKNVGESVRDPLKYYNNNINSLLRVLEYVERYKIPNLIFSSSCTVYGWPDSVPVGENESIKNSSSPYGQSKIICERILEDFYARNGWVNIVSLRYFNPIGGYDSIPIGENPTGGYESLMSRLNRWVFGLDNFKIYGDDYDTEDGSAIRDYLDVGDLSRCHVKCLEFVMQKGGFYNQYNVGTGGGISVKQLVNKYLEVNSIRNKVVEIAPRRMGDIDKIYASGSKIKRDMDFECIIPLEHSLESSYRWHKYLVSNKLMG